MFLKSLEIYGFKSFADRTHINFADGITALLGPNGCGKSNVVDAIKWVLAENRSKNLRAATMEDVIFNGTETRPPLSLAEVTLTIANENGLIPGEDLEVAIKRRLYRSGENEYFINGRQATATEIRKMFMDTGVGKAAYSVMEQGKIDQILSSKPEDRRYLFEEAAGISRSKAEVAEAERELERTRQNLAQIDLGLAETKRNYETLKVQADKTAKYRKLTEEKFNYELDIQLLKLKDFTQSKAQHESKRKEAEEKRDAAAKEIEEIYSTLNENTDKIKALQEEVTVKQQEVIKISAEQTGKKAMEKQLRDHQSELREKVGQLENRIKMIQERIDEYNEDIDSQNAELHEKNKQLADLNKNIQGFVANIQASSGQIDENEKQIGINGAKIHSLDDERQKLQEELAAITEDIVTELDAKLKDAGYSSASNRAAKESLTTQLEKIKIFATGRSNIFRDFASLSSHSAQETARFSTDAVQAFEDLGKMLGELSLALDAYTKTTPQFIDEFLSPEGIITKKRGIDTNIQQNISSVEQIRSENEQLAKTNAALSKKINEYRETLEKLRVNQAGMSQQIFSAEQQIKTLQRTLQAEQVSLKERQDELYEESRRRDEMDEQIEELGEQIAELQLQGEKITRELEQLDRQISECNSKVSGKQNALQKKQEETGLTIEYEKRFEKLQQVKMYIADRNVYGVDLNPIAVELAEVSLWLNTIYKGAFVPWFGTQLVCGNSLIGARRQVYYASKLEAGKWYDEAPVRIMLGEKRKRTGVSTRIYHFLLGDPGMSNYTDKVIKGLEPENIKKINNWRKEFTKKYDEDDLVTLQRLSDAIDTLWDKTVELRKSVEKATAILAAVEQHYGKEAKESSHLDGLSMEFGDWRFNLRRSNTEPLIRLNVEARGDIALCKVKTAELLAMIRK